MILLAVYLALLAAPPAKPPPLDAERPVAVVTIPDPKALSSRIEPFLHRFDKQKGDVAAAVRAFEKLPANALDDEQPIYAWFFGEREPIVIEMAVRDPEIFDRFLTSTVKSSSKTLLTIPFAKDQKDRFGVVRGTLERPIVIAIREERRLFVVAGTDRTPADDPMDPRAIRGAKLGSKPKRPPVIAKDEPRPPDVWFNGDGAGAIERATGAIWIERDQVRGKASLMLDMAAGLITGDLVGGDRSRMLLDGARLDSVAELSAKLSYSAMSTALDGERLDPSFAKLFAGDVDALLTSKGAIVVAVVVRPGAEEQVAEVVGTIGKRAGSAKLSLQRGGGDQLLIAVAGAESPKPILAPAETSSSAQALGPLHVVIDPSRLIRGLAAFALAEKRASAAEPYAERAKKLNLVLDSLRRLEADVRFPPGEISISASLDFAPRPPKR